MMKKMMSGTVSKTNVSRKTVVIATAITTLLSATAAFTIKAFRKSKLNKLKQEDKSELEIILDGLVEDGTITQDQLAAIQSAVTTAKEASTANDELTSEENLETTSVSDSNQPGTLARLKNSLSKGPQSNGL